LPGSVGLSLYVFHTRFFEEVGLDWVQCVRSSKKKGLWEGWFACWSFPMGSPWAIPFGSLGSGRLLWPPSLRTVSIQFFNPGVVEAINLPDDIRRPACDFPGRRTVSGIPASWGASWAISTCYEFPFPIHNPLTLSIRVVAHGLVYKFIQPVVEPPKSTSWSRTMLLGSPPANKCLRKVCIMFCSTPGAK
jgi:hypothetical protein